MPRQITLFRFEQSGKYIKLIVQTANEWLNKPRTYTITKSPIEIKHMIKELQGMLDKLESEQEF